MSTKENYEERKAELWLTWNEVTSNSRIRHNSVVCALLCLILYYMTSGFLHYAFCVICVLDVIVYLCCFIQRIKIIKWEKETNELRYKRAKELDSESFRKMAEPLNLWLQKNYHPHARIIIDCDTAEVVEGAEVERFDSIYNN